MEYEKLLKRVRTQIPKEVFEKPRFEVPKARGSIEGNKTIIINFSEISNYLRRRPQHLLKFMQNELATSGNIDGTRAVFVGKFSSAQINDKITRYVKEFVTCQVCGKPDTKIEKEERVSLLKCMACGAREPIRGIK